MGNRLKDKVCIVSGGGRGIGRAIVKRFSAEGAIVIAVSVSDSGRDAAAEAGGRAEFFKADMSHQGEVEALFDDCRRRHGRLDVLVNNAAVGHVQCRLHEIPMESWDQVMNTNLRGYFMAMKYGIPLMLESGGGAIVNVASVASFRGQPYTGAYVASKQGDHALTLTAALEYAKDNLRVNSVCPGLTDTDIVSGVTAEMRTFLESQVPIGRMGTAEEVANVALFLASDEASNVTGAAYMVDGGRTAG